MPADHESLPAMPDALGAAPSAPSPVSAASTSAALPSGPQMLDPRVIALDRLVGAMVGVIVSLGHLLAIVVVLLTNPWPWWALLTFALSWFPVAALMVWLAVWWPAIQYRHCKYRLDRDGIEIWTGVVWRQAVMVPRSRVQHIDVSQGPLERSHGLATLSIHTAGTQFSKVDLRGLDHGVALAVRDALLPKDAEPAV